MATITEDYVSFEVAKLLKEKGFDVPITTVWIDHTKLVGCPASINIHPNKVNWNGTAGSLKDIYFSAPTLQMAMKWLRKVHNIDIDIDAHCGMLGVKCYVAYVSTYKPYKLTDTDKECGLTEDDVKRRQVQSKFNTRIPSKGELIPAHEYFDSYEEACEAAIKYSLENLI